jgi:putative Mg2+ transporter-C (MgtC) family protein
LCAGVITRDGLNISGLTTAASIWTASAIGVLLGVGFYASALLLALLCMLSMSLLHRVEAMLPARATLDVSLTFQAAHPPTYEVVAGIAAARGYRLLRDTLSITFADGRAVWRFNVLALDRTNAMTPALLADEIAASEGIASFSISPVRN